MCEVLLEMIWCELLQFMCIILQIVVDVVIRINDEFFKKFFELWGLVEILDCE